MKMKKLIALIAVMSVSASMLAGCGKKNEVQTPTDNSVPDNVVQKADGENGDDAQTDTAERPQKQFEVKLDEREESERYKFSLDDISFIDTVTGKKLSVGMSMEDVEAIAGKSFTDDKNYRVYDGLVVQFTDEGQVASMIISGGMFPNDEQATRYMSVRGVGINTTFDDFAKAYGDIYNEATTNANNDTAANAVRYFKVEGNDVSYMGETLSNEQRAAAEKDKNIYVQYFMFADETNTVSAMRVSRYDYLSN